MRTKLRFIKNVIYKMKRSYGLPIDYHQPQTHTLDVESGVKTDILVRTHIPRAIVLKAREFRSFVYDLAFISANKDFTTGGFFDPEDRKVIIDSSDFPVNFVPKIDDYLIFNSAKYEVAEIHRFEDDYAFMMLVRKISGTDVIRVVDTYSSLTLQQSATAVIQDQLEQLVTSDLTLTQQLVEVP